MVRQTTERLEDKESRYTVVSLLVLREEATCDEMIRYVFKGEKPDRNVIILWLK